MSDKIKTEQHLIAYLQLFDDNNIPQDNESISKVKTIYEHILTYYKENIDFKNKYSLHIKFFSNIVVVSLKSDSPDMLVAKKDHLENNGQDTFFNLLLEQLIIFTSLLKFECEQLQIPLRGTITEGTYFADDVIV